MADKISWDSLFQRVFPWRFTAWEDRNGLKLEKVGPTLIRFLQNSLVSYFHSDLLYHLYYQKISRVNGLFWRFTHVRLPISLGGLSKGVFQWRNVNRKWAFSLLICLEAAKFVLLSVFTLIETICLKIYKLVPRVFSFSKPRGSWGRDWTKIKTFIINGSYPGWNISP